VPSAAEVQDRSSFWEQTLHIENKFTHRQSGTQRKCPRENVMESKRKEAKKKQDSQLTRQERYPSGATAWSGEFGATESH